MRDPFCGAEVFDPACAGLAAWIAAQYGAVAETCCLSSTRVGASEIPLIGQSLAFTALSPRQPAELPLADSAALLRYTRDTIAVNTTLRYNLRAISTQSRGAIMDSRG